MAGVLANRIKGTKIEIESFVQTAAVFSAFEAQMKPISAGYDYSALKVESCFNQNLHAAKEQRFAFLPIYFKTNYIQTRM